MTSSTFKSFMDSLFTYYGDRQQLDQLAMNVYKDLLKNVSDNKKDELYRKVVKYYKFFPKVPELDECVKAINSTTKDKQIYNNERCWLCMDRGFVDYTKKGIPPHTEYPYGFTARCNCEMGKVWTVFLPVANIFPQQAIDDMVAKNKKLFTPSSEELEKAKSIVNLTMEAMKK